MQILDFAPERCRHCGKYCAGWPLWRYNQHLDQCKARKAAQAEPEEIAMPSVKFCRYCNCRLQVSAKTFAAHEGQCEKNPNPVPIAESIDDKPKWQCPGCKKEVDYSHRNRHRCAVPTAANIEQMMLDATKAVMARNDRKRQQRQTTQCQRCKCTPCQTPDSCGKAIRAQAQHAERLRREAAELGRRPTD